VHCAENLLKSNPNKKWLSSKGTEERIICILQFDKPSSISSIEISNDGSASVELLLSRTAEDWTILLPTTALMTVNESRLNKNRQQIRSFQSSQLNEKWTRLKIICERKFHHGRQFGLRFIKLYSKSDEEKSSLPSNVDDKSEIMKNIVFVLNGFQDPLKSELRDKATSMGAVYTENWDEKCTHLMYVRTNWFVLWITQSFGSSCAFSKRPKLTQVQQTGKGFIVNKQWIFDCYEQNQLLSEKSYELKETRKRTKKKATENNEQETTAASKGVKRKRSRKKKSNEDEPDKQTLGEIPDFFHGKHFYVSYGDYDDNTLLDILRIILAYDGVVDGQITSDVGYVITNRMWNQDFDKV
jgi:hypothetical protein